MEEKKKNTNREMSFKKKIGKDKKTIASGGKLGRKAGISGVK